MLTLFLSIIFVAVASIADGMVEGFEFDGRGSFERKFGVDPKGFWGSKSHVITQQNFWNKHLGKFDFYHVADDIRKFFYLLSSLIGGTNTDVINDILLYIVTSPGLPLKYTVLFITLFLVGSVFKRLAMAWIRK